MPPQNKSLLICLGWNSHFAALLNEVIVFAKVRREIQRCVKGQDNVSFLMEFVCGYMRVIVWQISPTQPEPVLHPCAFSKLCWSL